MSHKGPFQPLPFCDSVILFSKVYDWRRSSTHNFHSPAKMRNKDKERELANTVDETMM